MLYSITSAFSLYILNCDSEKGFLDTDDCYTRISIKSRIRKVILLREETCKFLNKFLLLAMARDDRAGLS